MPLDAAYRRRTVAANFLAIALGSGLTVVIGIFTAAYSRRVLGPEAIGQVNWNLSLLALVGLLASPGLQVIGQRDIAADRTKTAAIASLVLSLQFVFAIAAYLALVLIALLKPRGADASALLLLQGLSLVVGAASVAWVLQAHQRMVAPSVASLALGLLQIPALVALVQRPEDVHIFVLYTLPFSLALVAYGFRHLARHDLLRPSDIRPTLTGGRDLLAQAWPIALSQAAVLLIYNSGALVLGFTHGDDEVGYYTTAYRLMFMSTVISGAMLSAYFPVLARIRDDPHQARRVAAEFTTLMAWMGLPIAALGWACGRHVNDLLFGTQFAASGPYFEWLCLAIGMVFVNIGLGTPLLAWGQQKLHFKITVAAAILNLVLGLALIPSHGGWGAVVGILAAEGLVLVLIVGARRRATTGGPSVVQPLIVPLLCSAAVALTIAAFAHGGARYWWLHLALGGIALLGSLVLFERRIVTTALGLLRRPT
ncbi:MAG: flippase [Enhydrobacter sp.]|nr:MAG: flippase [Enhydrobacter sp.]